MKTVVAIPAVGFRFVEHTGADLDAAKMVEPRPKADKYYRVTCREISTSQLKAIYLGDRLAWKEPLRTVSWSTKDVDCLPDVGDTLQIERTAGVDPTKKLGTLGHVGVKTERFRVRVVSVVEIK